jgi:hypothetical protein
MDLTKLKEATLLAIDPRWLSRSQIGWLSRSQIGGLSRSQIGWLSRSQIGGLSPDQIGWLSPDQIGWLSRSQIGWLSPDQIGWLSRSQIGGLSPDQIGWLSPDQIGGLSRSQIGWLSPDQTAIIFGDASVPKVERLYSRMLEEITESKRQLDQSTFGPEELIDVEHVCKTPMCIAGHTVNLAGAAGYALRRRFSFDIAARLIHRASCPDLPEPRYDNYPNAWALSYITEMAHIQDEQPA